MRFVKRILLFLVVNFAIILVLGTVMSLFRVQPYITPYGLNLESLLIYAAVIGFTGSIISLFLSRKMAKWMMGVKVVTEPRDHAESHLLSVIGNIAQQLGMKMPEVGVYASPEVNAFATGWSKNHSLVAVSSGLLQEMNEGEIEGVLAHEMAHITNGDMVTMTLIQGIVNTFVIFAARALAYVVQVALAKGDERGSIGGLSYWLTSIVFEIIFAILASMVVCWFSRRREFAADRGGAQFVGKSKMIAALRRLGTLTNRIDTRQKSLATMKIADQPSRFARAFSTHPPLEERIARLERA